MKIIVSDRIKYFGSTYIVTNKSNTCKQKNGINNFGFPLMAPQIIETVRNNVQSKTIIAQFISSVKFIKILLLFRYFKL